MGLRDRLRAGRASLPTLPGTGRTSPELEHLVAWAGARRGVEGFVEPQTPSTPTTLVLVADDGEWTRRRMPSRKDAFDVGRRLGLPVYDVAAVGYPPRMRAWTARQKEAGRPRSTGG